LRKQSYRDAIRLAKSTGESCTLVKRDEYCPNRGRIFSQAVG